MKPFFKAYFLLFVNGGVTLFLISLCISIE
jgi:hypothetical protein